MNLIKRLIPNHIKQKGKNFLYDLLKIPYANSGMPLEILKWLPVSEPINFLDIGANVGQFSEIICQEYNINKGILVEPLLNMIEVLEAKFPDKEKFTIVNAAIADVNAETDFYVNPEFDSVSSLLRVRNNNDELKSLSIKEPILTKIKTLTLDSMINENYLNSIDLIKIDVQGAEHLVLKGGVETLKRTKLVYTEFSFKPLYEQSSTFYDLYNFLSEHNFMLTNINPGYTSPIGELLQGDALFINKDFCLDKF
jgi:FkbM family methyltransferase